MKKQIFIDFDGTIFSTSRFKKDILHIFKCAGYSKEEIEKTYWEECKDYRYSIEGNLKRLARICEYDKAKIDPMVERVYKKVRKYLYKDTIPFLRKINREKYKVNLLTLGDIGFQRLKFDHSGLEKLFDDIYVTENQKWNYLKDIVKREEDFVMIDDRVDTSEKIKENFPNSLPIRIFRKDYDKNDPYLCRDCPKGAVQVVNLKEAFEYIK